MCINDPEPRDDPSRYPLTPAAADALDRYTRPRGSHDKGNVIRGLARAHPGHTASLIRHLSESERRGTAADITRQLVEHAQSQTKYVLAPVPFMFSPEELETVLLALGELVGDAWSATTKRHAADIAADLRFVALAEGVTNPAHGL